MEKDAGIYVRHILEAIDNIEADTKGYDFEKFRADRRARQQWLHEALVFSCSR